MSEEYIAKIAIEVLELRGSINKVILLPVFIKI